MNKVVKTVAAVALSVAALFGGTVLHATNRVKDYSPVSQVHYIADELDSDVTSITHNSSKSISRMRHNNDEPIYVGINNNFTESEKENIVQSLDYVFGIVGSINPHYKYKIVDAKEFGQKLNQGKTTIFYTEGDTLVVNKETGTMVNGQIDRSPDKMAGFVNKPLYNNYVITYNRAESEKGQEYQKEYTFLHELLHAFGLDDVYSLEYNKHPVYKYCGNTIMNGDYSYLNCIMPNDYKNLIAMYAPKASGKALENYIDQKEQKVASYEDQYYKYLLKCSQERIGMKSTLDTSRDYSFAFKRTLIKLDESVVIENYNISVNDGKYSFEIMDENNEIIDAAQGDIVDCGNGFVLKDVELKYSDRPLSSTTNYKDGYINNFVLLEHEGTQFLYNMADNDLIKLNQKNQELER